MSTTMIAPEIFAGMERVTATPDVRKVSVAEKNEKSIGQTGVPTAYKDEGVVQTELRLVPDGPVEYEDVEIRLSLLPEVVPTHEFDYIVQQLKDGWPLEHPLTLQRRGDGYVVRDGIHRLCALRAAGYETAPARLYAEAVDVGAVLTLALNNSRKPNPVAEFAAIQSLLEQGYSIEEIARHTGMPRGRVQQRLQLAGMDPCLMELFRQGAIAVGVAERIVRLPGVRQAELAEIARKRGREDPRAAAKRRLVTASDVLKVQAGDRSEVAALLGTELAGMGQGTVMTWRQEALQKVDEIINLLPVQAGAKIAQLLGRLRVLLDT